MKKITTLKIDERLLDMVQALFEDYRAKQDIITMLFELHKFDEEATLLNSVSFKAYEGQFREAKIAYDTCMEELRANCIPKEYQEEKYKFEVNFGEKCVDIWCN